MSYRTKDRREKSIKRGLKDIDFRVYSSKLMIVEALEAKDRGILAFDVGLWLRDKFSRDVKQRIIQRLSPPAKLMLVRPVLNQWYPVVLLRELYQAVDAELTPEHHQALESLGRFMALHGTQGIPEFLKRLVPMKTLMRQTQTIWRHYHNTGTAKAYMIGSKEGHSEGKLIIMDYDVGPTWGKIMKGYLEGLIEATGARQVKVTKEKCIHQGDRFCSWFASWKER